MPFVLRSASDEDNPKQVRPFNVQTTSGMLAYYTKKGSQTAFILLLGEGEQIAKGATSGEGEFDGIEWMRYAGRLLQPYDAASGLGDYIFHPGLETDVDLQFADPIQGRPTFFPELDSTFSGIPYVEVKLPTELSDGTGEPSESQVKVRTSKIQDYDSAGAPLGKSVTGNNARVAAFCAKYYGRIDILNRFHWPSWVTEFRDRCDFGLGWAEGAGDGLTGDYYNGANFDALVGTRVDSTIEFAFNGAQGAMGGMTVPFTIRWTGKFEAQTTEVHTFFTLADDGVKLWVNGVLLFNNWGPTIYGAVEQSGSIALAANTKYDITLEYYQQTGPGEVSLSFSTPTVAKQLVPKDSLFSSAGVATSGRVINRFDCDVVFPGTPWPRAWEEIMNRAPGVKWQIVNGKIHFLWGPARTSVKRFTYDPTQTVVRSNIVQKSVIAKKIDATKKPNYFAIGYLDKDTDLFEKKFVPIKRPELRNQANGKLNSLGVYHIGVARKSLADRFGETQMRRLSDRDIEVQLKGQKNSTTVAKCDLVELVHPLGDWRETLLAGHNGPVLMEVVKETFESTIETANEKAFILRIWNDGDYDDTAHGPISRRRGADILSRFTPAPLILSLELFEKPLSLPDGTPAISIDGVAQFSTTFPYAMFGRVWWRRPKDEKIITANSGTNRIVHTSAHGYATGTPVMLRNTGGAVPGALLDTLAYYVINPTSNDYQLANMPNGAAIDITSAGTGINYIAPFIVDDRPLEPDSVTKQAAFSLTGAELGIHKIRVVTETYTQQRLPFQQAVIHSIVVAPPLATLLKVFDNVPPKDSLDALGITIGVARVPGDPDGVWYGTNIWRDRGYGYERIATILNEASIGHSTNNAINWLGDGSGGSYGVLWIIKDGGSDFTNATLAEITAGKNNYFLGREKLGVQTWTNIGGGLWKGENLVRGLNHTSIFQSTHTAQEDFIQLDENMAFVPIEDRDKGTTIYLKAVTFGQFVADATPIALTVRGDSTRAYAISSPSLIRDARGDWGLSLIGNPRPGKASPLWIAEIYRDATFSVIEPGDPKILPMADSSTHASLIGSASVDIEGDTILTGHSEGNNLIGGAHDPDDLITSARVLGVTLDALSNTYQRFDFTIQWTGKNDEVKWIGDNWPIVCLQTQESIIPPYTPDPDNAPLSVAWETFGPYEGNVLGGTVKEVWRSFGQVIPGATRYNVDPGFAVALDLDTFLTEAFLIILLRTPTGPELAAAINTIQSPLGPTASGAASVLADLFNSAEYIARGRTTEEFISDLYQAYLGRIPEPLGAQYWLDVYNSDEAGPPPQGPGTGKPHLLAAFGESIQFKNIIEGIGQRGGRKGPRYTIILSGGEYRAYLSYAPGKAPIAKVSTPATGFPFPLRLVMGAAAAPTIEGIEPPTTDPDLGKGTCITNIVTGNVQPSTIFSLADQIAYVGISMNTIYVRFREHPDGFPTDVIGTV